MNIFAVDDDPIVAARSLCDKHVVKMVVETAQILSTASYLKGVYDKLLYAPTHVHHPSVTWAMESGSNYKWLLLHGRGLSHEYTVRYRKIHKTDAVLVKLESMAEQVWPGLSMCDPIDHTYFPQAMPEKYRGPDAVEAYRRYYLGEKAKFAKWRYTAPPIWWTNGKPNDVVAADTGDLGNPGSA